MNTLIDPNYGLPQDPSKAACKELLLKPLDVDDLMQKFYETPWEYDADYLWDSRLEEALDIFYTHGQIEFGDWTYRFVPYVCMDEDSLNLDIIACKENFEGVLRLIKDRYLHPFQYPLRDDIRDHADHFQRMLESANQTITQWNTIVTNSKTIFYKKPDIEKYKGHLLNMFFDEAVMNEWNTGMGLEFDDFDEFTDYIMFTHYHLDMAWGGNFPAIEFGPFELYLETVAYEDSTVLRFIMKMENVGLEFVPYSRQYSSRCGFTMETIRSEMDIWFREIVDSVVKWNEMVLGRRNFDEQRDNCKSQNRITS